MKRLFQRLTCSTAAILLMLNLFFALFHLSFTASETSSRSKEFHTKKEHTFLSFEKYTEEEDCEDNEEEEEEEVKTKQFHQSKKYSSTNFDYSSSIFIGQEFDFNYFYKQPETLPETYSYQVSLSHLSVPNWLFVRHILI